MGANGGVPVCGSSHQPTHYSDITAVNPPTSTTEGFASKDGNVEARAAAATSESSPKDRIEAPDPLCGNVWESCVNTMSERMEYKGEDLAGNTVLSCPVLSPH